MKGFIKVILMFLLYLFVGIAVFALITYFKDIKILNNIDHQLYFGAFSLGLAILDLVILWKKEDKDLIDNNDMLEDEQDDLPQEDKIEVEDPIKDAVLAQKDKEDILTEDISEEMINEESDQDLSSDNKQEIISEENQQQLVEEDSDQQKIENQQDISQQVQQHADTVEQQQEEFNEQQEQIEPLPQKINADLTDTQIMFINKSDNSYINEEGFPQLIVTKELSKDQIKTYEQLYQNQKEIDEETQRQLDEEEKQYLQEEKYENIIHILTVVIVLLVLANLVLGAYYAYLRLF